MCDGRVTRYHLAQLNVATARGAIGSPVMAGFMAGIEPVNALADAAPGFVWRLEDGDGPGATALRPSGPDLLVNMSVWETLAALRDFVYRNGPHLDSMRRRREWFHPMPEQHLVLWWVPAATFPAWTRRCPGSNCSAATAPPLAFTFREPCAAPATKPGTVASRSARAASRKPRERSRPARTLGHWHLSAFRTPNRDNPGAKPCVC